MVWFRFVSSVFNRIMQSELPPLLFLAPIAKILTLRSGQPFANEDTARFSRLYATQFKSRRSVFNRIMRSESIAIAVSNADCENPLVASYASYSFSLQPQKPMYQTMFFPIFFMLRLQTRVMSCCNSIVTLRFLEMLPRTSLE